MPIWVSGDREEGNEKSAAKQDQQSDEELSTLVETGTDGIGLSREEADWANRSSSAATSPGRLTKFSLSGEPGTGEPSLPGAGAPELGALTRSTIKYVQVNQKCHLKIDALEIPPDDFFNNELKKLAKTPSEVPLIPAFEGSIYWLNRIRSKNNDRLLYNVLD